MSKKNRLARRRNRASLALEQLEARVTPAPLMITPLAGVPYQDWTIVNYVDRDATAGLRDFTGNTGNAAYTYDGHNGIDFTLASFAAQDTGVPVFAAADGTVIATHDGHDDRNTDGEPCIDLLECYGNYVRIDHGDGWVTDYGHLRKDSVAVIPGQRLKAGEVIGLIGSSGNSTDSHLHFTVWENGQVVEMYENPNLFWRNPLPYAGSQPGVLDFGTTGFLGPDVTNDEFAAVLRRLKNRPEERDVFVAGQTVSFWALVHGNDTSALSIRWSRNGTAVREVTRDALAHYARRWDSMDVLNAGEWKAALLRNGVELAAKEFRVVARAMDEPAGTFEFSAPIFSITEGGKEALITVLRRGGSRGQVRVNFATSDGTARAGFDYLNTAGTLTFGSGQRIARFTVKLIDNFYREMPETVRLTLSNPAGGSFLCENPTAELRIYDTADADTPKFITPLAGVPQRDWSIMMHQDHDPSHNDEGLFFLNTQDYTGARGAPAYTYDGHEGTDFTIPSFARQDEGVPIFAAAAGRVVAIQDGNFDREFTSPIAPANGVTLDHGGGWFTRYWHMRKDSPAVAVGQEVEAGDVLGLVGSSGRSAGPHLHFDVIKGAKFVPDADGGHLEPDESSGTDDGVHWSDLDYVDPFQDRDRYWLPGHRYDYSADTPGVLGFGLTDVYPGDTMQFTGLEIPNDQRPWETLLNGARDRTLYAPGEKMWAWVQIHGIRAPQPGDTFNFRWIKPNGNESLPTRPALPAIPVHYGWVVEGFEPPANHGLGNWKVIFEYKRGGQTVLTTAKEFLVTDRGQPQWGKVQFSAAEYNVTESSKKATITVTRSGGRGTTDVPWSLVNGKAAAGSDVVGASGSVRFEPNQLSATFTVDVLDDLVPEAREDLQLRLGVPTGQATLGNRRTAVLNIYDDGDGVSASVGALQTLIINGCDVNSLAGGDDRFTISRVGGDIVVRTQYGPPSPNAARDEVYVQRFAADTIKTISVRGKGGSDTLTIDFSGGNPIPSGDIFFTGGDGDGIDRLILAGDSDFDLNQNRVFVSGRGEVHHQQTEEVELTGGPGDNHFAINFDGTTTVRGGDGNDSYTLNEFRGTTLIHDDKRGGVDSLQVNHTAGDALTARESRIFAGLAQVDFCGLEQLRIDTFDGGDTVQVVGVAPTIQAVIDTGTGEDTILVNWSASSVTSRGTTYFHDVNNLTIFGGFDGAVDRLIANDRTNRDLVVNYTLTENQVRAQGVAEALPVVFGYHAIDDLTLFLNDRISDITVTGTSAVTTIDAGLGVDRLVYDRAASVSNDSYNVFADRLERWPAQGITVSTIKYAAVEWMELNAGAGHNSIALHDSSVSELTIRAGAGDDTIDGVWGVVVAPPGLALPRYRHTVTKLTINGGLNHDVLTLNDRVNPNPDPYSISPNRIETRARTSKLATTVSVDYAGLESLQMDLGDGGSTITITGTAAETNTIVNAGGGDDAVEIRTKTQDVVDLEVNGENGAADSLTFYEWTDKQGDPFAIDQTTVVTRRSGTAPFSTVTYAHLIAGEPTSTLERLKIVGSFGNNYVLVNGTVAGVETTIEGGGGNDDIDVFNRTDGSRGSLRGPLNVKGLTHSLGDGLDIDDIGEASAPYLITPTTVSRHDIAPISYDTIEAFTVNNRSVYAVNTNLDTSDTAPGDGVARDAFGRVSLRAALEEANANSGSTDLVLFNLPSASRRIQVMRALPRITDPVTIDATSQPGYAGMPLVELTSVAGATIPAGLEITAGGTTVRGLSIFGFRGDGIQIRDGGGNHIEGNYLGMNANGVIDRGNKGHGVRIENSSANFIGEGNVIAGNGRDGVSIVGTMPSQTIGLWRGDFSVADSIESNFGYLINGATFGPGKVNQAFVLDGVNDWVEIPNHPNLTVGSFTLDAWVKPEELSRGQVIISKYDSALVNGLSWSLSMHAGGTLNLFVCQSFDGETATHRSVTTVTPALSAGAWQHVAASFDLSTQAMRIFVNGQEAATALHPQSSVLTSVGVSPTPVRLGTYFASGAVNGPTDMWRGAIDEAAVTGRVLSPAEIQAIVSAGAAGRQLAVNNAIRGNSIYVNGGLAIDLNDDGPTLNDSLELFGGANRGQNAPVLESARLVNASVEVTVSLRSRPSRTFSLDFYAGTRRRWVSTVIVTTDDAGVVQLPVLLDGLTTGEALFATATDVWGNTSEFSNPLTMP